MRTIRIFVSSPGDVQLERLKAAEVVERIQGEVSAHAKLMPYFWEHEPMLATRDFQENIPSPAEFDIVVCILWSRLGSRLHSKHRRHDGTAYQSGTEFEFEEAVRAWRQTNGERPDILVYRRDYLKLEITDENFVIKSPFVVRPLPGREGALEAAKELEDAEAIAERLVVHDPTNARWKNALAMTNVFRGEFFQKKNNSESALKSFRKAEAILEALIADDPQNAEFIRYRNQGRTKIAEILVLEGDRKGADEELNHLGDAQIAAAPSAQQFSEAELQRIQSKILAAEAQLRIGHWDAALMGYLEAAPALEKLAAPANANAAAVEALGVLLAQIGGAFVAKGSLAEAKEALARSIAVIRDRLLVIDPENPRWQTLLCKSEAQFGFALLGTGDSDAALRAYLSAVTRSEQLIQKRPASGDLQHDLSGIYIGLGDVLSKRGDRLGARRALEAAIQVAQKLVDRDPNNAVWQSGLAGYWTILGEALATERAPVEAIHAYRLSLVTWERLSARGQINPFWQTQEALACFRIAILLSRVNPANFREMRDMLLRCLTIMKRVKGTAVLSPDQQNLLRSCEVALQGLPV